MDINITINPSVRTKLGRLSKKAIVQLAQNACRGRCGTPHRPAGMQGELSILITSDKEIRRLNKKYRRKDKATDVLSFAPAEAKGFVCHANILGDVVISAETAKRQAREYKVSFAEEFTRLLIHGILHLLGYDHENVSVRKVREMQELEDKLLVGAYRIRPGRGGGAKT